MVKSVMPGLPDSIKQDFISLNQREYGVKYNYLRFIEPEEITRASAKRDKLLAELDQHIALGFNSAKLDCTNLSTGCQMCGAGAWSCLFINNLCNCSCFYCPTEQQSEDQPSTNNLTFERVNDYVDYLSIFNFKGASISGGEPFLTFDRSLAYLQGIKKAFGDNIYCWLYTNGTLATKDKLLMLKDCGLNEIRFDISATNYSLSHAKRAVDIIDTVTVEIPSLPEDMLTMQQKLREMQEAGISHLNLHQLRLTPFNFKNLMQRDYTFLHGAKVTVLESELNALELLAYRKNHNINMPINYCSFVYKNRFQGAAARKRAACIAKAVYEEITEPGYIRRSWLESDPEVLQQLASMLVASNTDPAEWRFDKVNGRLFLHLSALEMLPTTNAELCLAYYEAVIVAQKRSSNPHIECYINPDLTVFLEIKPVLPKTTMRLSGLTAPSPRFGNILDSLFAHPESGERIYRFEKIPAGLQEYF